MAPNLDTLHDSDEKRSDPSRRKHSMSIIKRVVWISTKLVRDCRTIGYEGNNIIHRVGDSAVMKGTISSFFVAIRRVAAIAVALHRHDLRTDS